MCCIKCDHDLLKNILLLRSLKPSCILMCPPCILPPLWNASSSLGEEPESPFVSPDPHIVLHTVDTQEHDIVPLPVGDPFSVLSF